MPDKVLYTAEATSTGNGRSGHVVSSDRRLDLDLDPPVEMGGSGNGTNPEQLFAAGYAACFHSALRLVARRAGVSQAAPYRHFASKEAILAAVAEDGFRSLIAAMRESVAARGEDPLGRLRAVGLGYVTFATAGP